MLMCVYTYKGGERLCNLLAALCATTNMVRMFISTRSVFTHGSPLAHHTKTIMRLHISCAFPPVWLCNTCVRRDGLGSIQRTCVNVQIKKTPHTSCAGGGV